MELNGISFAFGSFHSELFSPENSERSLSFYGPLCEISSWRWPFFFCSLRSLSSWISRVLKQIFEVLNTREQFILNSLRPQITFQPWIFTATTLKTSHSLCFVSFVWKAYARKQGAMWAYAFLNKPEALSPDMKLWLCGLTKWVLGGHGTYVYCKLRQILSFLV